ncbi:MAG TPA: trypsin-like serine protease [Chromatiaceae bacterium]|nr:trypsin-like serine protease [Chromatiaceae bacterium]
MSGPFSVGELMVKIRKSDGPVFDGCQIWKNGFGMSFGCSSAEFGMNNNRQFMQVNHYSGLSAIGKTWNATLIEPQVRSANAGRHKPSVPSPPRPLAADQKIGLGSCFAVSSDGYLVTNNHVIEGAKLIYVRTSKGEALPASVVAAAPSTDLAILKIDVRNMPYLSFASSKNVSLGEKVFTIGYPLAHMLGTDPKYTEGVVSSKSGLGGEAVTFQITVPIQPGNSGGPLVNQQGQVVGVITSTASSIAFFRESGNMPQNINWAVKSDYASLLLDEIPSRTPAKGRKEAIKNTEEAICMVLTKR